MQYLGKDSYPPYTFFTLEYLSIYYEYYEYNSYLRLFSWHVSYFLRFVLSLLYLELLGLGYSLKNTISLSFSLLIFFQQMRLEFSFEHR